MKLRLTHAHLRKSPRRLFALLLSLALTLSLLPLQHAAAKTGLSAFTARSTYQSGQFADVPAGAWFTENVRTAYELGLMQGKDTTHFDPEGNITVAEAITIAARMHALYHTGEASFSSGSPWYQPYVDYAKEHDLLPTSYPSYNPAATRVQFAQILSRALPDTELAAQNDIPDGSIPDILVSSEAAPDIYLLYRAGVMTGSDSQGSFLPAANIRRCEVAAIISRMVTPSLRKSLSLTAPASGTRVIASGDCSSIDMNQEGEMQLYALSRHESSCTWTLTDDGTLTIEGNGPMALYYHAEGGPGATFKDTRPWRAYLSDIRKIVVCDGVTSVGADAFMFCNNTTSLTLPDSITSIGEDFLFGCTSLAELRMPKTLSDPLSSFSFGYNVGGLSFGYNKGDSALTELYIPEGVENLRITFCCNSANIQTLHFPSTLKSISSYSIWDCGLKTVKIPASVERIGSMGLRQSVKDPIEKVYFYGDAPKWGTLAICNIGSGESAPASAQPTLYYIEGAAGFTSPTWTAPDGTVYQTATFDPAQIPFD